MLPRTNSRPIHATSLTALLSIAGAPPSRTDPRNAPTASVIMCIRPRTVQRRNTPRGSARRIAHDSALTTTIAPYHAAASHWSCGEAATQTEQGRANIQGARDASCCPPWRYFPAASFPASCNTPSQIFIESALSECYPIPHGNWSHHLRRAHLIITLAGFDLSTTGRFSPVRRHAHSGRLALSR